MDFTKDSTRNSLETLTKNIALFSHYFNNSILPEFMNALPALAENYIDLSDYNLRTELSIRLSKVTEFIENFTESLKSVHKEMKSKVESDPLFRTKEDDEFLSHLSDLNGVIKRFVSMGEFFEKFFCQDVSEKEVLWGERKRKNIFSFSITPLTIQEILNRELYEKIPSIIFSSATLTTGKKQDSFNFFFQQSGLELSKKEIVKLQLPSCFDYKKLLKVYIPKDISDPNSPRFDDQSIEIISELITASKGGALVLFTSIKHKEKAKTALINHQYEILSQGELSANALINKFRESDESSLLAVDTFWEGIDVKGETLRNLIIARLPFRFPSHPFIKRYIAELEEKTGKSGFMLYTLPDAVIKFKQGLGRLIRTNTDRGTVTILDRRMFEKSYGKEFLGVIPAGVEICDFPAKVSIQHIASFFAKRRF